MKTAFAHELAIATWVRKYRCETHQPSPDKCPSNQPPEVEVAASEIDLIRKKLQIVQNREKTSHPHCANPPKGLRTLTCVLLQIEEGAKPSEREIFAVIVRLSKQDPALVLRATAYSLCSYAPNREKPWYHVLLYEKRRPSLFSLLLGRRN